MYSMNFGRVTTLYFKNGYYITIDIGPWAQNHNKGSKRLLSDMPAWSAINSQLRCETAEIQVYYKGMDVTQQMIDKGILKRTGYVPADIFIKVANIIRKLDSTEYKVEKIFEFHWLDGKVDEFKGNTVAEAFTHGGYGNGALTALDYHVEKVSLEDAINFFHLMANNTIDRDEFESLIPHHSRIVMIDDNRITFEDGRKEYTDDSSRKFTPVELMMRKVEGMSDDYLRITHNNNKQGIGKDKFDEVDNVTWNDWVYAVNCEMEIRELQPINK